MTSGPAVPTRRSGPSVPRIVAAPAAPTATSAAEAARTRTRRGTGVTVLPSARAVEWFRRRRTGEPPPKEPRRTTMAKDHGPSVKDDEQFPPDDLLRQAVEAEDAGFDGVACSDHFQPWWEPGESGMAWVWLGAVGQATKRGSIGTAVTPALSRYHPALVAQAWATLEVM